MQDNTPLPASIRQRLEMAQNFMNESRPQEARSVLEQAACELARTEPELYALLVAGQMGYRGICATSVEETHSLERIEYKFMGIPFGEDWVPVTSRRIVTKTLRLF